MKILIIHTAFIGDIVLSTPLLKKIKDVYVESEVFYLTTPQGAEILKNNPHIKKIITYDKKGKNSGLKNLIKFGLNLKAEKFDLVITPHRYLRSSFLSWISGAKERVGYKNATGAFLFTKKISYDKNRHEVEKLLSFITENNSKDDLEYKIELYPGEEEKEKVSKFLKGLEGKKIIAIAPGSKWFTKKWPVEYFNATINSLSKKDNIFCVIIGGQEEKRLNLKLNDRCLDLRGQTTLLGLAELLSRCSGVVTNDSSPIHIASAYESCFIFAIFGPTVREFGFFPWSKKNYVFEKKLPCKPCSIHGGDKCPKGHFKCMLDIKPEEVIKKIEEILL